MAGCLVVLAHERGVVFQEGLSILVASDVPEGESRGGCGAAVEMLLLHTLQIAADCCRSALANQGLRLPCGMPACLHVGWLSIAQVHAAPPPTGQPPSPPLPAGKGVSSSAAIEVAVMSALLAAYDIQVEGRELALLCQKAENLVVGAPCGIMDQVRGGGHSRWWWWCTAGGGGGAQQVVVVVVHSRWWWWCTAGGGGAQQVVVVHSRWWWCTEGDVLVRHPV